jgi:hypothetical protein
LGKSAFKAFSFSALGTGLPLLPDLNRTGKEQGRTRNGPPMDIPLKQTGPWGIPVAFYIQELE